MCKINELLKIIIRSRKQAKKKGYTTSADTLYLSGWMLILTTLPIDILDTETVAALYCVRWQVEIDQTYCLHKSVCKKYFISGLIYPDTLSPALLA